MWEVFLLLVSSCLDKSGYPRNCLFFRWKCFLCRAEDTEEELRGAHSGDMCYSLLVDTSVTLKNLAFPEESSLLSTLPHPWSVLYFSLSPFSFVVWKEPCQESSCVCDVGMLTLLFLATSPKFFYIFMHVIFYLPSTAVL